MTQLTAKENNKKAFLYNEKPQWMPCGEYVLTCPKVNPDNIARAFVYDAVGLKPEEKIGGKDMFGIQWVYVPTAGGSMVAPGNPTVEDANDLADKVVWPNIEEWDWEASKEANKDYVNTDKSVQLWFLNGLFERLISFMDFEGAATALIDEDQQDAVKAFFAGLCDTYEKIFEKYIECYGMEWLVFHDDWGAQRAPFFSIDTCREMLVPYLKRLVDFCHSKGVIFELHSCGANELLIPAMIEAGVDVWTPMASINDLPKYYEVYGDKLHFGIGAPRFTAEQEAEEGADEKIKAAAKEYVDKYTKDGKVISGGGMFFGGKIKEYIMEYSKAVYNA